MPSLDGLVAHAPLFRGARSMAMLTVAHTSKRTKSLMSVRTSRSTRMRLLKDELLDEMNVLTRLRRTGTSKVFCLHKTDLDVCT